MPSATASAWVGRDHSLPTLKGQRRHRTAGTWEGRSSSRRIPRKTREILAAQARWRRAASEFSGLGKKLRARTELRNIRLTLCGYQVVITRNYQQTSRSFSGFSEASLRAAMRFRDEILPLVPPARANPIPAQVLRALGLSAPVVGIARVPYRSAYTAGYVNSKGKNAARYFYYRQLSEVEAYAAAIVFLQERLEAGNRK